MRSHWSACAGCSQLLARTWTLRKLRSAFILIGRMFYIMGIKNNCPSNLLIATAAHVNAQRLLCKEISYAKKSMCWPFFALQWCSSAKASILWPLTSTEPRLCHLLFGNKSQISHFNVLCFQNSLWIQLRTVRVVPNALEWVVHPKLFTLIKGKCQFMSAKKSIIQYMGVY